MAIATPPPNVVIRKDNSGLNEVLDKNADINARFQALVQWAKRNNEQLSIVQASNGGNAATVPVVSPDENGMALGGAFTYPHGLGGTPKAVFFEMTSGGIFWFQDPPYDSQNLYLVASGPSLTGNARIFL